MIWACFSYRGISEVANIDGTVNNEKYIEIMEKCLMPFISKYHSNNEFIYQDDNAPAHRHRNVKQWMTDNKITTIEWPAQSPDMMDPIENLWHFLEMKVFKCGCKNKKRI
ncbi:MAG: hypothetical protein MHMPM18_005210 [Marteilia pararefringens]